MYADDLCILFDNNQIKYIDNNDKKNNNTIEFIIYYIYQLKKFK